MPRLPASYVIRMPPRRGLLPIGELSTGNVDNISCDEEAPDSACARLGTQPKQKLLSPRVGGAGGEASFSPLLIPLLQHVKRFLLLSTVGE